MNEQEVEFKSDIYSEDHKQEHFNGNTNIHENVDNTENYFFFRYGKEVTVLTYDRAIKGASRKDISIHMSPHLLKIYSDNVLDALPTVEKPKASEVNKSE